MKKIIAAILVLALCTALFCGCTVWVNSVGGLSSVRYDHAEQYAVGGASLTDTVEKVCISWLCGRVNVLSHGEDTVTFSETSNQTLTDDISVHYWLDGTTLWLRFCRNGNWDLNGLDKELTVFLPEGLMLKELEIDSVSAKVSLRDIRAKDADISTVSGSVSIEDCFVTGLARIETTSGAVRAEFPEGVEKVKVNTVSGSVEVSAKEIGFFDADTTSGSVTLSAVVPPKEADIGTVSGDVTLRLPETAGFALDFHTVSGGFTAELPCTGTNGKYRFGNGEGDYHVSTTSGKLTVRKGEAVWDTEYAS